jgi:hypothetical protein
MDIKHLPKLRTTNGESRKRYLYVAIDRCSRWVHLAVYDDELSTSAIAFLKEAVHAFPFKATHVLTDRGSCFAADGFEAACRQLKVQHCTTKSYTPQTNGLAERFNGRVQREVLGITIDSHQDLETLLKGFNQAYNRRRQRVLKRASPEQVVHRRLAAEPGLANRRSKPPNPQALPQALQVAAAAKEVSHPDTQSSPAASWPAGMFLYPPGHWREENYDGNQLGREIRGRSLLQSGRACRQRRGKDNGFQAVLLKNRTALPVARHPHSLDQPLPVRVD